EKAVRPDRGRAPRPTHKAGDREDGGQAASSKQRIRLTGSRIAPNMGERSEQDCQETCMWETIVGWFKALFSGKGTTQIGKGNQAVSGSSTGDNSPVVTAGRDVHFNMSAPVAPQDPSSDFAELEDTIPDLLSDLREGLADHPFIRDIIVLDKKSIAYNWPDEHLRFSADESPGIRSKIQVLENRGLISERKDRFAYRMSEKLAGYLRKGSSTG